MRYGIWRVSLKFECLEDMKTHANSRLVRITEMVKAQEANEQKRTAPPPPAKDEKKHDYRKTKMRRNHQVIVNASS